MEDDRSHRAEVRVDANKGGRKIRVEGEREERRSRDVDEDDDWSERRGRRLLGVAPISADTVTHLHRGLARSLSEGLRAYEQELDPDNKGHVDGLLSGAAAFWEEFASAMSRTADNLRDDRNRAQTRRRRRRAREEGRAARERDEDPPRIDYERLARLVAQELKKSQPVVVNPAGTPITRE